MSSKPNVILILVDDMGFSDLGITGSEIRTPNIDGLAKDGVLLSAMYNCARCLPDTGLASNRSLSAQRRRRPYGRQSGHTGLSGFPSQRQRDDR